MKGGDFLLGLGVVGIIGIWWKGPYRLILHTRRFVFENDQGETEVAARTYALQVITGPQRQDMGKFLYRVMEDSDIHSICTQCLATNEDIGIKKSQ